MYAENGVLMDLEYQCSLLKRLDGNKIAIPLNEDMCPK